MKSYTQFAEDFTRNLNLSKEELFRVLEREGKLAEGTTAESLSKQYAVVAVEPSWLGSIIAKLYKEQDRLTFHVVKLV